MSVSYKLNKTCLICGVKISDKNKSGYCNKHINRTGVNNPFYGKTHSKETMDIIKAKNSIASKKKWEDPIYREKVLNAVTGLKRSEEFKELQRQHAIEQFKNKEQHEIRSKMLTEMWQDGKLIPKTSKSINRSKLEIEFVSLLKEKLDEIQEGGCFRYKDSNNKNRWLYPDAIYNNFVIEFNGDYWHANPNKYKENDIVHHKMMAKEIWEKDNNKIKLYNDLGYTVIIIWQSEYKQNKIEAVNKVIKLISNK